MCWTDEIAVAALARELRFLRIARRVVYDESDLYASLYEGITRRIVHIMEVKAVRNADVVTTLSEELRRVRIRQGAGRDNVHVFENGVDYRLLTRAYAARLKRVKKPGFRPKVLVYSGQLSFLNGKSLCFEEVFRKRPDARLLIAGFGNLPSEYLRNSLRPHVEYVGQIPYRRMPAVLSRGDIGLALLTEEAFAYGVPLKVLDYAAAGLPVIASDFPPIDRFVKRGRIGIATAEGKFSEAILRMLDISPQEYLKMSRRANSYAKKYDYSALCERYEKLLLKLGVL